MKINNFFNLHKKVMTALGVCVCLILVIAGWEYVANRYKTTVEIQGIENITNTSATLKTDKGTLKIKLNGVFADRLVYCGLRQDNLDALMSNTVSVSYSKPMIVWSKYPRLGRNIELSYVSSVSPITQAVTCDYTDGKLTVTVNTPKDKKLYVNKNYELMSKAEDGDIATLDLNSKDPVTFEVPEDRAKILISEIYDMRYDVNGGEPSEPIQEGKID